MKAKKFRILIELVLLFIVISHYTKGFLYIMQPIFNRYHADNALCKHYNSCLDNLTIWYWNLKHNATMLWLSVKWNLEIAQSFKHKRIWQHILHVPVKYAIVLRFHALVSVSQVLFLIKISFIYQYTRFRLTKSKIFTSSHNIPSILSGAL